MLQVVPEFIDSYYYLSNFAPCRNGVMYEGKIYPTSEHAYQAAKTLDENEREVIRKASSPGIAKKLGRHCKIQPNWDNLKFGVMGEIVRNKFARNSELRVMLLQTEDAYLVEGNTWGDTIWGVCEGKGSNHLGKILMKVRRELVK